VISKDIGKALLSFGVITVILVFARLAWLARSYPLGFDLVGIWKTWGGCIVLWVLITGGCVVLLVIKRP
jgi:hypothetical protein